LIGESTKMAGFNTPDTLYLFDSAIMAEHWSVGMAASASVPYLLPALAGYASVNAAFLVAWMELIFHHTILSLPCREGNTPMGHLECTDT
jgi:hypothetical protein